MSPIVMRTLGWLGVLALVACTPAAPTGGAVPTAAPVPQELTFAASGILPNLDPHTNAGTYAGIKYTLFDTVTRIDPSGTVGPWLAASWKANDPTTWEFKLRENVVFSNGEKLDAAAVKFSIDRLIDPANKLALASRITLVSGATVVDPLTVRITTKQPDAILPARMAAIFVVPPAEVAKIGPEQFGVKPVGSGPFKVETYAQDSKLVLVKNGTSWHPAKLDKLTVLGLPEASSRVAALRSGDAQVIIEPPVDQISVIERDGFAVVTGTRAVVHVADFDQITEDTPLRDKRVRQALNYAVDKETLAKTVFKGQASVLDAQLVLPSGYGFDSSLKPYPYDPARARQLLAEAGYPNGFATSIDAPTAGFLNSRDQAVALQGYLREVGVRAELNVVELGVFLDRFYNRNGQKRSPIFTWSPTYAPALDADFVLTWYTTTSLKKVYSNPEYDRLYAASTVELDAARRLSLLRQMSQLLREDAAILYLIAPNDIYAVSKKVQGLVLRPDGETPFETLTISR